MAHILYYGTHGSDEPTRAVLPFHMAKGALEAGHTAELRDADIAIIEGMMGLFGSTRRRR